MPEYEIEAKASEQLYISKSQSFKHFQKPENRSVQQVIKRLFELFYISEDVVDKWYRHFNEQLNFERLFFFFQQKYA